jgi:hypothetical protein
MKDPDFEKFSKMWELNLFFPPKIMGCGKAGDQVSAP